MLAEVQAELERLMKEDASPDRIFDAVCTLPHLVSVSATSAGITATLQDGATTQTFALHIVNDLDLRPGESITFEACDDAASLMIPNFDQPVARRPQVGEGLARLADWMPQKLRRAVLELVADMRVEHNDAAREGDTRGARLAVWRGRISFAVAIFKGLSWLLPLVKRLF